MVLEAGKLGTWGNGKVLESIELPTLTSWSVLVVLKWLEVNASSPLLRTVVFLLPQQLSGGVPACVGPLHHTDWILKGHLFSGLPLATRGLDCYMVE